MTLGIMTRQATHEYSITVEGMVYPLNDDGLIRWNPEDRNPVETGFVWYRGALPPTFDISDHYCIQYRKRKFWISTKHAPRGISKRELLTILDGLGAMQRIFGYTIEEEIVKGELYKVGCTVINIPKIREWIEEVTRKKPGKTCEGSEPVMGEDLPPPPAQT